MKKLSVYLILFLACLGCSIVTKEPEDKRWAVKTEEYWESSNNEEYSKALAIAREQVKYGEANFPKSVFMAESYYRLGYAFKNAKSFDSAEYYLRLALKSFEEKGITTAYAHRSLAQAYKQSGRNDSALVSIRESLKAFSEKPNGDSVAIFEAKVTLADLLIIKRDYAQAKALIDEIHKYGVSAKDSSFIIDALSSGLTLDLHHYKFDNTVERAVQLISYYHRHRNMEAYGDAMSLLAAVYYMQQRYDEAIGQFNDVADFKLKHFKDSAYIGLTLKNLATTYEKKGDLANSSKYYRLYERHKK